MTIKFALHGTQGIEDSLRTAGGPGSGNFGHGSYVVNRETRQGLIHATVSVSQHETEQEAHNAAKSAAKSTGDTHVVVQRGTAERSKELARYEGQSAASAWSQMSKESATGAKQEAQRLSDHANSLSKTATTKSDHINAARAHSNAARAQRPLSSEKARYHSAKSVDHSLKS